MGLNRILGGAVLAWALAMVLVPASTASAGDEHLTTREYLERMDAFYAPLMNAPADQLSGTGFKPYQRYKYLVERRLGNFDDVPPGARWQAWEEMKRLEAQHGTGSLTWFSLGPTNVSGRCLAIRVHPTDSNTAYAGFASGGVWKTVDGGTTWLPLGDDLPSMAVGAIEIDGNNPERIWIGTGEGTRNADAIHGVGVLVSTDGGLNWSPTGYSYDIADGRDVFELEYNPATGTLILATDNGLWRSTDGGDSFTQVGTGAWWDVKLQAASTTTMFALSSASTNPGFYRSFDDGQTWTRSTVGVPTTGIENQSIGLTAADPDIVYWALDLGGGTSIYKSTDGGASFALAFTGSHYGTQGWYNLTIAVDPLDPDHVFSGGVRFYRSTNGAASFSEHGSGIHVDHHAVEWAPSNPTHFWVGSDGGVWRSTNSGVNFSSRNAGLTTMQFYAINHSMTLPSRALGGSQDNGTRKYDDSPLWTSAIGADGFFCEIDRADEDVLYGEIQYGDHRRSLNGGASFQPINNGITQNGPWSTPTWMDFADPHTLWTAHTSRMFKTTNRGDLWTQVPGLSFTGGGVNIHQSLSNPDRIAFVTSGKVWLSLDHGATWLDRGGGGFITDIHVHPTNPDIMVVTQASYSASVRTVRKTIDGGLTWTAIDTGLPDEPANTIEIDPANPNTYFIGTDLGVYVSFDAGASWLPFNTGLPHVLVSDLRIHDGARVLRAGTYGRGLWEVDISGLTGATSVAEHPTVQPLTLRVLGSPARAAATLRYGMREAGHVRLALYDAGGRLVQLLVDRFHQPVMGSVDVNVGDLGPGVYFARLDANGATVSRKLIVQR